MVLWLYKKFYSYRYKNSKKLYVKALVKKAISLQEYSKYKDAKKIYIDILNSNLELDSFEYSVILNNLVVVCYYNNELKEARDYYKKLSRLREKMLYSDIELYGIDYIYTKLMGLEWFNIKIAKDEISSLKELLTYYKGIYNTKYLEEKIRTLL